MSHLTVCQIIDFVSSTELNESTKKLIATVNKHICECPECLEKVQAFQTIYDEFRFRLDDEEMKNFLASYDEKNKTEKEAEKKAEKEEDVPRPYYSGDK